MQLQVMSSSPSLPIGWWNWWSHWSAINANTSSITIDAMVVNGKQQAQFLSVCLSLSSICWTSPQCRMAAANTLDRNCLQPCRICRGRSWILELGRPRALGSFRAACSTSRRRFSSSSHRSCRFVYINLCCDVHACTIAGILQRLQSCSNPGGTAAGRRCRSEQCASPRLSLCWRNTKDDTSARTTRVMGLEL